MNGNGNDSEEPPEGLGRADRSTPSGRRESRPTPGTDPNIGAIFDGRYRIEQQIGVGGMGVVYRAVHTSLDRDVVVKLLSRDHLEDEAAVKRFEREARTLGRLDHANIVTVYDFGYQDDVSYIVMEHVDGEQLDQLVQRDGPLAPARFVPLASQILDAVGRAHREGLVHRDMKPSNVMVSQAADGTDTVKVLDFGLAKLVSGENDVTKQDSLIGSMPYLSPEQIRGDEIDQRVDVYALGILMYYMLAGRKPFRGKNASILYDQVHSEPPPLQLHVSEPDAIPEGLYSLISQCLDKKPDERPQDAQEALETLERVAAGHGSVTTPNGSMPGPTHPAAGPPASQSDELETREPSSSELLGKTSDTSDHVEVRRRSESRNVEPDPAGEPTENLGGVGTSDSAIRTDPDSGRWLDPATLVTLVSSAIVVGGLAFWLIPSWTEDPTPATDTREADAGSDEPPEIVMEQLRQVDRLIEKGNVEGAEALLESIISTYDEADKLDDEITRRQRRIHVARLYRKARKAEEAGEYGRAMEHLRDATKLDDSFRDAAERLRKLEKLTHLRVAAVEGATVEINGETVGKVPLETWLEAGAHDIALHVDDEHVWSKTLRVGVGEEISLEPDPEDVEAVPSSSQDDEEKEQPEPDSAGAGSGSGGADDSGGGDGGADWSPDDFELVPE